MYVPLVHIRSCRRLSCVSKDSKIECDNNIKQSDNTTLCTEIENINSNPGESIVHGRYQL